MGDAGSQSLFLVLTYPCWHKMAFSIVQLDDTDSSVIYSAHFMRPPPSMDLTPFNFMFCTLPSSTNYLYIVPDYQCGGKVSPLPPLHCAAFNCSTKKLHLIQSPNSHKFRGFAVNGGQDIYFLAHPFRYEKRESSSVLFERYIPAQDKWEEQVPFPDQGVRRLCSRAIIVASAVWDDIILFNMGGYQIWAYHVVDLKWYHVLVENENDREGDGKENKYNTNTSRCYDIVDEGFAFNNIIYALSNKPSLDTVLALSINRKEDVNGDLQFSCSLHSEIFVPQPEEVNFWPTTRRFVHYGDGNFSLVESCDFSDYDVNQPVRVTKMKLMGGGKMVVTNVSKHWFPSRQGQFRIGFCFSLHVCKTAAVKQPEETFFFNPYNGIVSEQEDKTNFNPEPEEENTTLPKGGPLLNDVEANSDLELKAPILGNLYERSNTDEEGHSIIVANLRFDATAREVEEGLKKFGHLKTDMIRFTRDTKENVCYAYVDFESAISMKHAMEASPIIIRGCPADILKKRRTPVAEVDS